MTKNARDLEILIGIILVLLSIFSFYTIYLAIGWRIETWEKFYRHQYEFSWFDILIDLRLGIITAVMFLLGGIFIIANKVIGWYFTTIQSINSVVALLFIPSVQVSDVKVSFVDWIAYSISIILALIVVFMFTKQVRLKYKLTQKAYIYVAIGVSILLIDRFLI